MNKKNNPIINMGSASMLVSFLVLCLITFAVLSLSSALSDYHYSERISINNTAYYKACNTAEDKLAQIDTVLLTCSQNSLADYYEQLPTALNAVSGLNITSDALHTKIAYTIPIDDSVSLAVELLISDPAKAKDTLYQITRWQKISTKEWVGDNSLKLIDGGK